MRRAPAVAFLLIHLGLGIIALTSGCGSTAQPIKPPVVTPTPDPAPVATVPDPAPPELRLPTTVRPLHHEVSLVIDPSTEDFTGSITIDLAVSEATSVVWLHGIEITLKSASLAGDKQLYAVRPIYPRKD